MSLTTGGGPFGSHPAGRFVSPMPSDVVYVEPFRRRVRGFRGGAVVLDSDAVLLVHRTGAPPTYAFPAVSVPASSVLADLAAPEPGAPGHVQVPWDALDEWWEEDEPMLGHPRNPYHRVDCIRTSRRLSVSAAGLVLVDTTSTVGVYETGHEPRLYVSPDLVRTDLLLASATSTYCPYKGAASYWTLALPDGTTIPDVAWSYDSPLPESAPIAGLLGFDGSKVELDADLPVAAAVPVPVDA